MAKGVLRAIQGRGGPCLWPSRRALVSEAFKYDTSQAFLYGDVEQDLYSRAPDWSPEHITEVYCLKLKKNIYGTRQAARPWHIKLLTWLDEHE